MQPSTMTRDFATRTTVAGIFRNREACQRAINALKQAGFDESQIGVAAQDRAEQATITKETGTQAAEGAVGGATSGGLVGGLVGLLVGIGSLAVPGVGPVIAGGVLASTLAGAGIGAVGGGVLGALVGLGIPETEAQYFETGFRAGGILLTVNASGKAAEAVRIIEQNGGDTAASATGTPMNTTSAAVTTEREGGAGLA